MGSFFISIPIQQRCLTHTHSCFVVVVVSFFRKSAGAQVVLLFHSTPLNFGVIEFTLRWREARDDVTMKKWCVWTPWDWEAFFRSSRSFEMQSVFGDHFELQDLHVEECVEWMCVVALSPTSNKKRGKESVYPQQTHFICRIDGNTTTPLPPSYQALVTDARCDSRHQRHWLNFCENTSYE